MVLSLILAVPPVDVAGKELEDIQEKRVYSEEEELKLEEEKKRRQERYSGILEPIECNLNELPIELYKRAAWIFKVNDQVLLEANDGTVDFGKMEAPFITTSTEIPPLLIGQWLRRPETTSAQIIDRLFTSRDREVHIKTYLGLVAAITTWSARFNKASYVQILFDKFPTTRIIFPIRLLVMSCISCGKSHGKTTRLVLCTACSMRTCRDCEKMVRDVLHPWVCSGQKFEQVWEDDDYEKDKKTDDQGKQSQVVADSIVRHRTELMMIEAVQAGQISISELGSAMRRLRHRQTTEGGEVKIEGEELMKEMKKMKKKGIKAQGDLITDAQVQTFLTKTFGINAAKRLVKTHAERKERKKPENTLINMSDIELPVEQLIYCSSDKLHYALFGNVKKHGVVSDHRLMEVAVAFANEQALNQKYVNPLTQISYHKNVEVMFIDMDIKTLVDWLSGPPDTTVSDEDVRWLIRIRQAVKQGLDEGKAAMLIVCGIRFITFSIIGWQFPKFVADFMTCCLSCGEIHDVETSTSDTFLLCRHCDVYTTCSKVECAAKSYFQHCLICPYTLSKSFLAVANQDLLTGAVYLEFQQKSRRVVPVVMCQALAAELGKSPKTESEVWNHEVYCMLTSTLVDSKINRERFLNTSGPKNMIEGIVHADNAGLLHLLSTSLFMIISESPLAREEMALFALRALRDLSRTSLGIRSLCTAVKLDLFGQKVHNLSCIISAGWSEIKATPEVIEITEKDDEFVLDMSEMIQFLVNFSKRLSSTVYVMATFFSAGPSPLITRVLADKKFLPHLLKAMRTLGTVEKAAVKETNVEAYSSILGSILSFILDNEDKGVSLLSLFGEKEGVKDLVDILLSWFRFDHPVLKYSGPTLLGILLKCRGVSVDLLQHLIVETDFLKLVVGTMITAEQHPIVDHPRRAALKCFLAFVNACVWILRTAFVPLRRYRQLIDALEDMMPDEKEHFIQTGHMIDEDSENNFRDAEKFFKKPKAKGPKVVVPEAPPAFPMEVEAIKSLLNILDGPLVSSQFLKYLQWCLHSRDPYCLHHTLQIYQNIFFLNRPVQVMQFFYGLYSGIGPVAGSRAPRHLMIFHVDKLLSDFPTRVYKPFIPAKSVNLAKATNAAAKAHGSAIPEVNEETGMTPEEELETMDSMKKTVNSLTLSNASLIAQLLLAAITCSRHARHAFMNYYSLESILEFNIFAHLKLEAMMPTFMTSPEKLMEDKDMLNAYETMKYLHRVQHIINFRKTDIPPDIALENQLLNALVLTEERHQAYVKKKAAEQILTYFEQLYFHKVLEEEEKVSKKKYTGPPRKCVECTYMEKEKFDRNDWRTCPNCEGTWWCSMACKRDNLLVHRRNVCGKATKKAVAAARGWSKAGRAATKMLTKNLTGNAFVRGNSDRFSGVVDLARKKKGDLDVGSPKQKPGTPKAPKSPKSLPPVEGRGLSEPSVRSVGSNKTAKIPGSASKKKTKKKPKTKKKVKEEDSTSSIDPLESARSDTGSTLSSLSRSLSTLSDDSRLSDDDELSLDLPRRVKNDSLVKDFSDVITEKLESLQQSNGEKRGRRHRRIVTGDSDSSLPSIVGISESQTPIIDWDRAAGSEETVSTESRTISKTTVFPRINSTNKLQMTRHPSAMSGSVYAETVHPFDGDFSEHDGQLSPIPLGRMSMGLSPRED